MSVIVQVTPEFRPDASRTGLYVFSYHIRLENLLPVRIQLMARHWVIEEAQGETTVVEGEGVIGLQPVIESGASFEYSSWVQVKRLPAFMRGHYLCLNAEHEPFQVNIPMFTLRLPGEVLN
ncbi:Co2+/Mg2+ efflux protein ApaG [Deinococcus cellulosilyticus]|nr:Co2+/Mg2+ efflux protein ApaG [Deinococcus cellulosilyticus]